MLAVLSRDMQIFPSLIVDRVPDIRFPPASHFSLPVHRTHSCNMSPHEQESFLEFDTRTGFNIRMVRREPHRHPYHHTYPHPSHITRYPSIRNQLETLCIQPDVPFTRNSETSYTHTSADNGEILAFSMPQRFSDDTTPIGSRFQASIPDAACVHPAQSGNPKLHLNYQARMGLVDATYSSQTLGAFQTENEVSFQPTFENLSFQEHGPSSAHQTFYLKPDPISPRIQSSSIKNRPISSSSSTSASTSASPLSDAPTRSKPSSPGHYRSKARHRFNAGQTSVLKTRFGATPMPTPPQIAAVAREVGSEYGKVKVWFQNRRAVLKRRAGKADGSGSRKEADGGESSSGSEYKE